MKRLLILLVAAFSRVPAVGFKAGAYGVRVTDGESRITLNKLVVISRRQPSKTENFHPRMANATIDPIQKMPHIRV